MQVLEPGELSEELIKKKLVGSKILEEGSKSTRKTMVRSAPTKEKVKFVDEPAVVQSLKDLIDDKKETSYVVLGYQGATALDIVATGTGPVEEIKELLKPGEVNFVIMGVMFEEVNFKEYKYLLIGWVGPEVKPLHRARASQARPVLYKYCKTYLQLQAEYQAHSLEDLTTKKLLSKLFGSSIV